MTIDTRDDILPSPTLTPQPSFRVQTRIAHGADVQAGNLHGWKQTCDQLAAGCFVGGAWGFWPSETLKAAVGDRRVVEEESTFAH
jgi:hypothetical protein